MGSNLYFLITSTLLVSVLGNVSDSNAVELLKLKAPFILYTGSWCYMVRMIK